MFNPKKLLLLALIPLLLTASSCQEQLPEPEKKPELLIYCGFTMGKAVREIANRFEQQENCQIKMIQGGSGNLYRSILVNRAGDLYLPGSESYIEKARSSNLVTDAVVVGSNRAALVVAKGNPLGISADINNLLSAHYRTVLGSPDSSSIGKETERILSASGIYHQAIDRTLYLTSDSKGLSEAIRSDKADLALNWLATVRWPENLYSVDAIELDPEIAPEHRLLLGLLQYSRHSELARSFMAFAASDEGHAVFADFGLGR
ncbi:molybdate transport system substrate-binding protein [Malonomonas rubra DSM 5091]|uniref:Molybdate transport system substrate-binding protein n=1 Tax=Malonomonas rubra DSM 5091 TaxID=1122189 RepID=A0A1M6GNG7_MALRU|nr:substrate-binding domain-containing protein [Malonomonas rubra]SHJ11505.1 molybdate transport system substrate-binding protein [Malonomonas rubra DSM 5091]